MGGVGSGKKKGVKTKQTSESLPFLDIRQLHKQGYLIPNTQGSFTWSIAGKAICSIGYRMYMNKMVLLYRHRSNDGEWVSAEQDIVFDKTGCNYGGDLL